MDRIETLGPAESIVRTLTQFTGHLVHNRPGVLRVGGVAGVEWSPVRIRKGKGVAQVVEGRHTIGTLGDDGMVWQGARMVARYHRPGVVPEVATYLYQQVANVWAMDQKFVAQWASWAWSQQNRDLKVVLAGFMLVQDRVGAAVRENNEVLFYDDDYRDVGEAMCSLASDHTLSPKLLLRVGEILRLPGVTAINQSLGFGQSNRNLMGRWPRLVTKWLRYREQNPTVLQGLVRAGYRTTVQKLARIVGYRPESPGFFKTLRWHQTQSPDGRRTMGLGERYAADTWDQWTEERVCAEILATRPSYKRIVGQLGDRGLTPAVLAAAVEAGVLSDTDYVILSPTFEDLGVLGDPTIKDRWVAALQRAETQRAANVARRVQSRETKEALEQAADKAAATAIAEVTRDLRVYCCVDKSSSMDQALGTAVDYVTRFLGAFPLDRLHVSVFNTWGTELEIKAPSRAAVAHAFNPHHAGGGTNYAAGVKTLVDKGYHREGGEDIICLFIGDEGDADAVGLARVAEPLKPVAFGLLPVVSPGWGRGRIVRDAAACLKIPCFEIDAKMFETNDPYAVTQTFRNLIASTPVGVATAPQVAAPRVSLIEQIAKTALLQKPAWA